MSRVGVFGTARRREALCGYLFIMPNFLGFLAFILLPVAASLAISFCQWDILTDPVYVGPANFVEVVRNPDFWRYCWNTLFLMLGLPIGMAISLALALLMNQKLKGIVLFRTVFFLPSITAGVALYMLWQWIYNPDVGLLNVLLGHLGIDGPRWLQDPFWAKPALILMGIWTGAGGYNMILYLAALQGIPPHLYEAAEIDGAGAWQRFRHITWPMVSPTTFFISIIGVIGGFQGNFESVYVMTQGGPAGSTTTLSFYIYNNAYELYHMGYAAAVAWFLFLVVFLITMVNWRYGGKLVQY